MNTPAIKRLSAIFLLAGLAAPLHAQDSVSTTPGVSDALSPYYHPSIQRYVVDMVPLTSSWGNAYRIAPILKACVDLDPLFSTQLLGSAAVSPDQQTNVTLPNTPFSSWNAPGAGVNPDFNSAPGSVSSTGYSRQFGVGFSDLASIASDAVGALVGQDSQQPNRLFVARTLGVSSRQSESDPNTATVSLGGIDSRGNMYIRADNFGGSGQQIVGENILRINLPARNSFGADLSFNGSTNTSAQPAAITYVINSGATTTNTPAVLPQGASPALALVLDFANNYRAGNAAGVTTHLASGIAAHRGNPSFSTVNTLGGVGTVASLAKATSATRVQAFNLFAVNSTGGIAATRGAVMPANITDGAGFTSNAAGTAEFLQYLSQTTFRGGNGPVGVGLDPLTSTSIAAGVATDPTNGEFIAVARFGASVTWTVAAHEGKPVLDGVAGSPIGTIANAAPVSFSAPGVDLQGNIYFVAAFQPTVGPLGTAFIKAVNTASGYRLERILASGESFTGANSARLYTVEKLTLADSDSTASGTFWSGNLLQPQFPGQAPSNAADPRAFGGAAVNARISYNNAGTPETYQAVLFIGANIAPPPPVCLGDANNDNIVNFSDVTSVLGNFGNSYTPGSNGAGDANNDGPVNFSDVTAVLANFGDTCP